MKKRFTTKTLMATVVALLFIAAFPLAVSAAAAVTSLSIDRTAITQGQSITFNLRTTAQTNFVFAMVDGVRTQGTRVSGNDWTVTVFPTRATTVSIFANTDNVENGAAVINVPVTITGATTGVTTPSHTVVIPPAPPNLGPIEIASVTETPAIREGYVQLTVVTGIETNEVWVNFDRVNNARATGSFRRATMLSQDTNSRTWVINFRPAAWAAQTVEVGSNRTYNWPGAATQVVNLTLAQPFVPPTAPEIRSVNVSPRNVNTGGRTTFTIRTNLDVEHVWIRDVDSREFTASRTTSTATERTWTVDLHPQRSGNVTVFANVTRTETGAVTRTENVTIGHNVGNAQFVGTPTAQWLSSDRTRINVTTNRYAETVWAIMPGSGNRVALNRTNTGSGNRTWSVDAWDGNQSGRIEIGISSLTGNLNNLTAEETRSIWASDVSSGSGEIRRVEHFTTSDREARPGGQVWFRVMTSLDVDELRVHLSRDVEHFHVIRGPRVGNEREWEVRVDISFDAPDRGNVNFEIRAYDNERRRIDERNTPNVNMIR